jgi:translation initiation factor IF-1
MVSSLFVAAKEKKALEWQTGTLVAQNTTLEDAGCSGGTCGGTYHRTHYTIETSNKRYVANRTGGRINVTVNGPVKFAIHGNTLYLMDADGKSHDCHLEQEALKTQ